MKGQSFFVAEMAELRVILEREQTCAAKAREHYVYLPTKYYRSIAVARCGV